ncbi:WD40-repeat-containing domain [Pseudocohnilembus persalinus]|uniref:WD40-repeat-containing domain n=1 Tax=Pseudocohnilembus persalinus TaxID=266149 RepID=A0A0V0QNM8_PSEPJ|nr:WD40-repeat-containing domain [Pseudocohnilembus persalinus]|eukprot:KRX03697.1 WD40-repeat-containing domain [Pseudocohnilembus persalinus]
MRLIIEGEEKNQEQYEQIIERIHNYISQFYQFILLRPYIYKEDKKNIKSIVKQRMDTIQSNNNYLEMSLTQRLGISMQEQEMNGSDRSILKGENSIDLSFTDLNQQQQFIQHQQQVFLHNKKIVDTNKDNILTISSYEYNFGNAIFKKNEKELTITTKSGLCNLQEFIIERNKNKIQWKKKELFYLFKQMVKFVCFLFNYDYFYGEIMPLNIILEEIAPSKLIIKFINLSNITDSLESNQNSVSQIYSNSYIRFKKLEQHQTFLTKEERFKNEIFSVLRTFQFVCIYSQHDRDLQKTFMNNITKQSVFQLMDTIKYRVFYDWYQNDNQVKEIFNFMEQKILTEKYSYDELIQFIENQDLFMNSYSQEFNISDNENIARSLLLNTLRSTKSFSKQVILEKNYLFQQENFVGNYKCSPQEHGGQEYDLEQEIYKFLEFNTDNDRIQFEAILERDKLKENEIKENLKKLKIELEDLKLQDQKGSGWQVVKKIVNKEKEAEKALKLQRNQQQTEELEDNLKELKHQISKIQKLINEIPVQAQVLIILGEQGAGKTTFLLDLYKKLSARNFQNLDYFNFSQYTDLLTIENKLRNTLYEQDTQENFCYLLDSLNDIQEEVDLTILFQMAQRKNLKLVVGCRKNFFSENQFQNMYTFRGIYPQNIQRQKIKFQYLRAFDKNQIQQYVGKFIQSAIVKKIMFQTKVFKQPNQYLDKFFRNDLLLKMAQNPLFLRLLMEAYPKIESKLEEQLKKPFIIKEDFYKKYYSKYNIFQEFTQIWFQRELEKWNEKGNLEKKDEIQEFNNLLAFQLYKNNQLSFKYNFILQVGKKFDNVEQLFKCSPLNKVNEICEYKHSFFKEFFVAKTIIAELEILIIQHLRDPKANLNILQLKACNLNQKLLTMKDQSILNLVTDHFIYFSQHQNVLKDFLLINIMMATKNQLGEHISNIAANAATIFNALNFSFSELDLSNTKLNGALLMQAIMHKTNLQGAVLDDVNLTDAILTEANFDGASMKNVNFGRLPHLIGHQSSVMALSFSPTNSYIVSGGSFDNKVILWNYLTGEKISELSGHSSTIYDVKFSPDGRKIATGSQVSYNETLRIWDGETGEPISVIPKFNRTIEFLEWSPDSNYLVTVGQQLKQWDIEKCTERKQLKGYKNLRGCKYTPDGEYIVFGTEKYQICIMKEHDFQVETTLKGHTNEINGLEVSKDGKFIVSVSEDNTIRVWNIQSKQQIQIIKGTQEKFTSVTISPQNKYIAAGCYDKSIHIWHMLSGAKFRQLDGHTDDIHCVEFSPDGSYIASGSSDELIRLWQLDSSGTLKYMQGQDEIIMALGCYKIGTTSYLIAGLQKGIIKYWNLDTGDKIREDQLDYGEGNLEQILISDSGKYAVLVNQRTKIIYYYNLKKKLLIWKMNEKQQYSVLSLCFFPNMAYLVVGSQYYFTYLWNLSDGEQTKQFMGQNKHLTYNQINQLEGKQGDVLSVTVSHNNQLLACGYIDGTIIVFGLELQGHKEIHYLIGHDNWVTSLSFSFDNQFLVSGSNDTTFKFWSMEFGREQLEIDDHYRVYLRLHICK